MVQFLSHQIALGRDEILPSHIAAEHLEIEPLIDCGVAVFKEHDLDTYLCTDCGGCDNGPKLWWDAESDGKRRLCFHCAEEPDEKYGKRQYIDPRAVAVYDIDVLAVCGIIGAGFGCEEDPRPIIKISGAWIVGRTARGIANRTRQVVFVRRFDGATRDALAQDRSLSKGAIIIAASIATDSELPSCEVFSFTEVCKYGGDGLRLDLDPVLLRFDIRTEELRSEKKTVRKEDKSVLEKVKKLVNYLKNQVCALTALLNSDERGAYNNTLEAMRQYNMGYLCRVFKAKDAPCKIGRTSLYDYLDESKHTGDPMFEAAHFWWRACRSMDALQDVADILKKVYPRQMNKLHEIDGCEMYHKIILHLPKG